MTDTQPLISVVIPAYNAARTLAETLHSVQAQTYQRLEILVVDDGSTDETAGIVAVHAADDARIRLIRQANGGVCNARNRGIEEAAGEFVALLDSDDLWRPTKLEKQLSAFARGGPRIGLAYTQFVLIDEAGRIVGESSTPRPEGDVLRDLCTRNIVGHGSSALIHRSVFERVGGFDPRLTLGCEDHQMYFRIAEQYDFVAVQEPLVGYRLSSDSLSSNIGEMLATSRLLSEEMFRKHPQFRAEIRLGRCLLKYWMLRLALRNGQRSQALALAADLTLRAPLFMAGKVLGLGRGRLARQRSLLVGRPASRMPSMEAPSSFL